MTQLALNLNEVSNVNSITHVLETNLVNQFPNICSMKRFSKESYTLSEDDKSLLSIEERNSKTTIHILDQNLRNEKFCKTILNQLKDNNINLSNIVVC